MNLELFSRTIEFMSSHFIPYAIGILTVSYVLYKIQLNKRLNGDLR